MIGTRRDTDFGPEPGADSIPRLRRLRAEGEPIVILVAGKEHRVTDDASFTRLLDLVDRLETLDGIRAGLDDLNAGLGRHAADVFADISAEFDARRKA